MQLGEQLVGHKCQPVRLRFLQMLLMLLLLLLLLLSVVRRGWTDESNEWVVPLPLPAAPDALAILPPTLLPPGAPSLLAVLLCPLSLLLVRAPPQI